MIVTDSRWVALDRLSRIIPDDRKNVPCGKWVMVRNFPYHPILIMKGSFLDSPLCDPRVRAEALRFNKRRYRFIRRR